MRLIGNIFQKTNAERFSAYLKAKGIENHVEGPKEAAESQPLYQIWVVDEDRLEEALALFLQFIKDPLNGAFAVPKQVIVPREDQERPREADRVSKKSTPVTLFFLILCSLVFAINWIQTIQLEKKSHSKAELPLTPIASAMLYDLPSTQEMTDQTPYWGGAYDWVVLKLSGVKTVVIEGPMFVKLRQGELWRLFSPAILHLNLLHILFNMLWLWTLGRPVEQRIGSLRTFILTLMVGIGSNTAQYLMSGPYFLGYSGIVMGLAGFIWVRQRKAPWEVYPLQRSTLLFLALFIGAMLILQIVSFLIQVSVSTSFVLSIANTAHIAGALMGICLGCWNRFAKRLP